MKKRFLIALLLVCSIGVALAAIADMTGKWTGSVLGPDGNTYPLTYNFKTDGDKLTGTAESPAGNSSIENGKIAGNEFTFNLNINGTDVPHKGKYYTDSIALHLDYNGTDLHTTLKRADK